MQIKSGLATVGCASGFFGACCAAEMCLQRSHWCLPSNVFATASDRGQFCEYVTIITPHATDCSVIQCRPIDAQSIAIISARLIDRITSRIYFVTGAAVNTLSFDDCGITWGIRYSFRFCLPKDERCK